MLSYRILLLILFVFAANLAAAQDEATSRFIDSLKKHPQTNTPSLYDSTDEDDTEAFADTAVAAPEIPADTAITSELRPINSDTIAGIKKDKGFYYQSWLDSILRAQEPRLQIKKPPPRIDLSGLETFIAVFKIVLWILAGGLLLFILVRLFFGNAALFLTTRKNIDATIDVQEEQMSSSGYEALIKKAESEHNYRLAVRYLHLQALYILSQKRYIQLASQKTNYQYINELRNGNEAIAGFFSDLTSRYEYVWYGQYPITEFMYSSLRASFGAFYNKVTGG